MSANQPYIVSARKYRPATFNTVVGQRALTATLKNAIKGGKLAQAYLFCGPRGVGKTSCARIFAKTINCLNPTPDGEACGECESCRAIDRGSSFNLMELDAASNNSVENIRNITEQVNIPAQDGRYRVFIIDEVHMLSNQAFNAFLKTLEEPPKNVVFILATTERHKVIPTILSRCQIYDFRRITVNDIIDHLQYVAESEGVEVEREALGVIALKADGAMRDALSIFDQVVASTQGKVTYEGVVDALNVLDQDYYFRLVDIFRKGDVAEALLLFKEITDKGFDAQFFINGLADHIRNLMVSADPRTEKLLETSEEWSRRYQAQAPSLPIEWYYSAIKILNDTDFNYKTSGNKRLLVELALIRLSRLLNAQPLVPNTPAPSGGGSVNVAGGPFVAPDGEKPQAVPGVKNQEAQSAAIKPKEAESGSSKGNKVETNEPKTAYTPGKNRVEKEEKKEPVSNRRVAPGRPTSFRLSVESSGTPDNKPEGPQKTAFTDEEFLRYWNEYADTHPEQRILIAAMRSSNPVRLGDYEYRVVVEHPAQKQAFEGSMSELLDFLKKKLQNDYITLAVGIEEKNEEKKLPDKELLKQIIEDNEELAKFLKAIDAELEVG